MQKILLVDDEQGIRESLSVMLRMEGYEVTTLENADKALELIDSGSTFDFIVTDIRMPGMNGMEFIGEIKKRDDDPVIIMITAYGSHETSIEAVKKGADDYINKPVRVEELILRMKMSEERKTLKKDNTQLRQQLGKPSGFDDFISESRIINNIKDLASKASRYDTTVLITGESGTGKELLARSIHKNSVRKDGPFLAVNCAAIPDNLLESELFGYAKGAFTGATESKPGLMENANGGTLFLDEIGDIPIHLQSKLLRVLQEQEVRRLGETKSRDIDVRIIAATNRELEDEVKAGNFRSDLFYRLNVLPIRVPSLRERREDIPVLVQFFIDKFNKKLNRKVRGFSREAMNELLRYPWYGNVRELENFIERTMIFNESDVIESIELPDPASRKADSIDTWLDTMTMEQAKSRIEKAYIEKALEKTEGNRTKAAEYLGISRRNLLYKLKEYLSGEDT